MSRRQSGHERRWEQRAETPRYAIREPGFRTPSAAERRLSRFTDDVRATLQTMFVVAWQREAPEPVVVYDDVLPRLIGLPLPGNRAAIWSPETKYRVVPITEDISEIADAEWHLSALEWVSHVKRLLNRVHEQ